MNTTTDVIIIGGGLAGCSLAYHLAQHQISSVVIEQDVALSNGASGNPLGLLSPYLTEADENQQHFYLQAFRDTTAFVNDAIENKELNLAQQTGSIQLPSSARIKKLVARSHNDPLPFGITGINHSLCEEISGIKLRVFSQGEEGTDVANPQLALHIPTSILLSPRELSDLWVKRTGPHCRTYLTQSAEKIEIRSKGDSWSVSTRSRNSAINTATFCASHVVIANSYLAPQFEQTRWLPVEKIRGQIALLQQAPALTSLKVPLSFDGYLFPASSSGVILGASFEHGNYEESPLSASTEKMFTKAAQWVNCFNDSIPAHRPKVLSERVSFRTSTHDRFPYIGEVPDISNLKGIKTRWSGFSAGQLLYHKNLFTLTGFGSRGITSAFYSSKLLADRIAQDISLPPIVEPARYVSKMVKQESLFRLFL